MYAEKVTDSMRRAIAETDRRREIQRRYNEAHGITPQSVKRNITDLGMAVNEADYVTVPLAADGGVEYQPEELPRMVAELELQMRQASAAMEFERAAELRDRLLALKELELGLPARAVGMKGLLGSGAVGPPGRRAGPRRTDAGRPGMKKRRR
jgi:excinuclease ABC subunit B